MDLSGLFAGENFTLIGNFPYNISSQIMFRALEYTDRHPPHRRDVPTGSRPTTHRPSGEQSVRHPVGAAGRVLPSGVPVHRTGNRLLPSPESKVGRHSAGTPGRHPADFKAGALAAVVKAAFNQRRKTLRNALRPLGIPSGLADHPLLDRRAEQLSSAEFLDLSRWEWGN